MGANSNTQGNSSYRWIGVYYPTPPARTDARLDVGDALLQSAKPADPASGSLADTIKALDDTIVWTAAQVVVEMTVSSTRPILLKAVERVSGKLDNDSLRFTLERARALLEGVAYLGALRAIANMCSYHLSVERWEEVMETARETSNSFSSYALVPSLLADQAHVYLRQAERPAPAQSVPELARVGGEYLTAAYVNALTQPWNPFVRHRLLAEIREHEAILGPPLATLKSLFAIANYVQSAWAPADDHWRELTGRRGDDLEAFLETRENLGALRLDGKQVAAPTRDSMPADVRRLIETPQTLPHEWVTMP